MDEAKPAGSAVKLYAAILATQGMTERAGQREMVERIDAGLRDEDGKRVIVAEAPTGTGKSIAYLVGAYHAAIEAGKKLLITTSTIALQRQIIEHDIPKLERVVGAAVRAAIVKGRNGYVCDMALHAAAGKDPAQAELDIGATAPEWEIATWRERPTLTQRDQVEAILLARAGGWNGDFEDYDAEVDPEVRAAVTLGRTACAGQTCAFFVKCAHRHAKQEARMATIVVSNHDMLLTDLARNGGGVLLPAPGDAVIVCDEAHTLPETAIERFGTEVRVTAMRKAIARWPALFKDIEAALGPERTNATTVQARMDAHTRLAGLADDLDRTSRLLGIDGTKPTVRFSPSKWPDLIATATSLRQSLGTLAAYMENKREQLREADGKIQRNIAAKLIASIGVQHQNAVGWAAWARTVMAAATRAPEAAPIATWAECAKDGSVTLHAAPTDVAGHLRSWLIDRAYGLVFTSATLRTLGTFDYFSARAGLNGKDARYIALPSPFALDKQASVVVPAEACDPRNETSHTVAVARAIESTYARDSGTLVLFTSKRQMLATRALLDPEIAKRVLTSGTKPVEKLLKTHRGRVKKKQPSILFGMDSFSEGLDLPGKECEVVIIARLPFRSPADPVSETRSEWLTARGRSYFAEESVPQAYCRLVQRVGRLIRSEKDAGTIHIMDRRITSTQYGRRMWDTLPPYSKQIEQMSRPAQVA